MLKLIISGGQTGVDRAALDAALHCNIQCGGHCPNGRLAEDGKIHSRYPLKELISKRYMDRTLKNILDADGTVIIYNKALNGGTALTSKLCEKHKKPHLLVSAFDTNVYKTHKLIDQFINNNQIEILNIAGPRKSQWDAGYDYAYFCISATLKRII